MSKRSVTCRVAGILLSTLILFTCCSQLIGSVRAASVMSQKEKLGSPLLDGSFTTNQWQPNELAVWGIFLSNFCTPLVDDYNSTFSDESDRGTDGRGRNCLMFGQDIADETLNSMLQYACEVQAGSNRQVYVRQVKVNSVAISQDNVSTKLEYGEWREANAFDFISMSNDDGAKLDSGVGGDMESWCQFGVQKPGDGDNGYEIVFDQLNGYDFNSWVVLYISSFYGPYKSQFVEQWKIVDEKDSGRGIPLKMDVFGNIVMFKDGHNIVVFPACSNSHITDKETYNFLTSVFMNNQYIKMDSESMSRNIEGTDFESSTMPDGEYALVHSSAAWEKLRNGILVGLNTSEELKYVKETFDRYWAYNSGTDFNPMLYCDVLYSNIFRYNKNPPLEIKIKGASDVDTRSFSFFWGSMRKASDYTDDYPVLINPNVSSLMEIDIYGKYKSNIFGDPVVVDTYHWQDNEEGNKDLTMRKFVTYAGKVYNTKEYEVNKSFPDVRAGVNKNTSLDNLSDSLMRKGEYTSELFASYMKSMLANGSGYGDSTDLTTYKFGDYGGTRYADYEFWDELPEHIASLYPKNTVFSNVSSYLSTSVRSDDTELALYCRSMYYTYLKWYGVLTSSYDNKLNPIVFSPDSDIFKKDVSDFLGESTLSEEQKKAEVLNKTYLMLDPVKGKELRKQIYTNSFQDIMFDWYNKAVYGSSKYTSTENTEGSVGANATSQGFLGVNDYYSNPFTSWFVNIYDDIALILLGVGLLIVLIVFLLFKKKFTWLIMSVMMLVTVIIITPSIGDIVPYVCDKVIEGSFDDQLEYWALCENVENMRIENDTSLTDINGESVSSDTQALVQELNINFADRALMLKYDISRKVTSSGLANMDELQNLKTTAWILPQLLRQFSSDNGSEDYVYVGMSDALKAARQLYGAYVPRSEKDANAVRLNPDDMYNGGTRRNKAFGGASDDYIYDDNFNTSSVGTEGLYGIKPLSLGTVKVHKVFFYLGEAARSGDGTITENYLNVPNFSVQASDSGDKSAYEVREKDINDIASRQDVQDSFREYCDLMERTGGLYNNMKNDTVSKQYGYMWATESPLIYMYFNMKDTYINYLEGYSSLSGHYDTDDATGEVISSPVNMNKNDNGVILNDRTRVKAIVDMIQEEFIADPMGKSDDHRVGFMHEAKYGKTKDFLDLRTLLTDVSPYLYKTQLIAGGQGGKDGVFGEEKITLYPIYKNNYKSWMFRCNWAEKLYTNKDFYSPYKVTNSEGKRVNVNSQIFPTQYAHDLGRPMVFSEAERDYLGLKDTDLSIVELKCIECNKQTAKDITMLLNYVNMDGITTEALIQQMSLIATTNFCKYLSPDNGYNNQKALYPRSVSLRNISFDAAVRVMMLGASNDSYYTYGNTMYNMIANSGVISIILLMLCAFACVFLIPFIRNVLMASLLFLGLWSTLTSFVVGQKQKWKITASYIINLLIFLVSNVVYFLGISLIMNITSPTDILKDGTVGISIHSPTWVLFILLALCVVFIVFTVKQLIFTLKNYKDMGAMMFGIMISGIGDKISNGLSAIGDKLGLGSNGGVTTESGKEIVSGDKGERGNNGSDGRNGKDGRRGRRGSDSESSSDSSSENSDTEVDDDEQSSAYTNDVVEDDSEDEAVNIDERVDRGRRDIKDERDTDNSNDNKDDSEE